MYDRSRVTATAVPLGQRYAQRQLYWLPGQLGNAGGLAAV